ncbi:MAG: Unknown protein [uncultured Campylobacterales bacterium]|uniref:Periplasmic protein n=1 Tax=uncultured Campylobacterales bacterium TaxID=352960 RepID=A0A6S6SUP2_9BACT|nr:MAG: Unknown protein [uncultured Campylobacterales bacterium]
MNKILLLFLLNIVLYSSTIRESISIFLGQKDQQINTRFINMIFKDESRFYKGQDKVDVKKVYQALEQNGLIKDLEPRTYNILFTSTSSKTNIVFIKVLSQIFNSMGFNKRVPVKSSFVDNKIEYQVKLKLKYLNYENFYKEFYKRGINITNFYKSGNKIICELDTSNIEISAKKISSNDRLNSSLFPYLVEVENLNKIIIKNSIPWEPNVIIYDSEFNTLKNTSQSRRKNMILTLPSNSKYLYISTKYDKTNFIDGLTIEVIQ